MDNSYSPADQNERDAVLDITRNFIVRAPAGSGKTSLLVDRYLSLLCCVKKPEEILAITFTRKAAAEMRNRVMQKLNFESSPLADCAREANRENEWHILENPNRLKIQTIDSLNATLASSFPIQSGLSPELKIGDNSDQLYQLAVQSVFQAINFTRRNTGNLSRKARTDTDAEIEVLSNMLALMGNDFDRANRLITSMLSKRDQWLAHTDQIQGRALDSKHDKQSVVNQILGSSIRSLNLGTTKAFVTALSTRQLEEVFLLFQFSRNNLNTVAAHADAADAQIHVPQLAQDWRALGNLLVTTQGKLRKTVNVKQGFPPGAGDNKLMKERMIALLQGLQVHTTLCNQLGLIPDADLSDEESENLNTLSTGLTLAAKQLQLVFLQEGKIDYTQMSLAAIQALGDSDNVSDLALALDYKIHHLLVDEYQDTSWSQNELLIRLTREWQMDQGRSFFAVGDPMQSIYRFRDADVSLFLRSHELPIGTLQLEVSNLSANFRSSPELVEWFNAVFGECFGDSANYNLGSIPYQASVSARSDLSNKIVQAVSLDIFSGEYSNLSEAQFVANQIAELRNKKPLDDSENHESIAILVRSRAHIIAIVAELDALKIKWQGTDIDSLRDEAAIIDLMSLISALWQPENNIALFAVLRSPMFGLELADLLVLSKHFHGCQAHCYLEVLILCDLQSLDLSDQATQVLSRSLPCLARARDQLGRTLPRQIIEQVWFRLGSSEIYSGQRSSKAVGKLFGLIEQQSQNNAVYNLDLSDLKMALESLYVDTTPSKNTVQVMTIHKAKGLQFDHVFLPALARTTRSSSKELLRWRLNGEHLLIASSLNDHVGSLYNWLKAEDAERERNEIRRLMYVASTRACLSLHLSASLEQEQGPSKSALLYTIWNSLESLARWHTAEIILQEPQLANVENTNFRLPADYRWQLPHSTSKRLFLGATPEPVDITAQSKDAIESQGGDSEEIVLGLFIHEILYQLSFGLPENISQFITAQAIKWKQQLAKQVNTAGVMEHAQSAATLLNIAEQQITGVLNDPDGRWLLSEKRLDALSEAPFTGFYQNILTHVVIDRSFVDNEGVRWIIDYKSARKPEMLSEEKFISQQLIWHGPQLRKYAALISAWKPQVIKLAIYFTALPRLVPLEPGCE